MAVAGPVDFAQAAIEETPIGPPRQPHRRMIHGDSLLKRRPKQTPLAIMPKL